MNIKFIKGGWGRRTAQERLEAPSVQAPTVQRSSNCQNPKFTWARGRFPGDSHNSQDLQCDFFGKPAGNYDSYKNYDNGLARSRSLGPRGLLASPRFLSPLPKRLKSTNLSSDFWTGSPFAWLRRRQEEQMTLFATVNSALYNSSNRDNLGSTNRIYAQNPFSPCCSRGRWFDDFWLCLA
jgi:hypothetical protein